MEVSANRLVAPGQYPRGGQHVRILLRTGHVPPAAYWIGRSDAWRVRDRAALARTRPAAQPPDPAQGLFLVREARAVPTNRELIRILSPPLLRDIFAGHWPGRQKNRP